MKNILVLTGGGNSDESVSATAYAVAQPLGAHLEFLHVRLEPGEAAAWEPHAEFPRGPGLREMMERLRAESIMRTSTARSHFEQFCKENAIVVGAEPRLGDTMSASWREETGDTERRLMFCARHHDLVIVGRRTRPNGLPSDLIERLLLGSGRPLLIAPKQPRSPRLATIIVCWKETAEAARSVAAAMPLLVNAERVILAGVEERDPSLADGLRDLSRQMAWHGINAEIELRASGGRPTAEMLMAAARSHRADLLVMGAYGHSRMRETIFGGFTRSVLESADLAVFLMH